MRGKKTAVSERARTGRDRVKGYRERLQQQGLRPIQIWVPDTRSPGFAAEAHRQSAAVAKSPHAADDQAFIDAIADDILR
jgi:DNA-binding LacI/PurR family transcriptional regulator